MWFNFLGSNPTKEELALGWPKKKGPLSYRLLQDKEEDLTRPALESGERKFRVMEKVDIAGRRFWREVIKAGDMTDEEAEDHRTEWMEEESFDKEIERLMQKTF